MNNIIKTLSRYEPLNAEETEALQRLNAFMKSTTLKKGHYLFQEGEQPDRVCYVEFGLLRQFFLDTGDNEKIVQFFKEEDFVHDCHAFYQQRPIDYYVQALEDCELTYFRLEEIEHFQRDFPVFETIGRKMLEDQVGSHKEHVNLLMKSSPEDRYRLIMEKNPELIQRVSVTHLAQYLSVSRETLSRMRAKIFESATL